MITGRLLTIILIHWRITKMIIFIDGICQEIIGVNLYLLEQEIGWLYMPLYISDMK